MAFEEYVKNAKEICELIITLLDRLRQEWRSREMRKEIIEAMEREKFTDRIRPLVSSLRYGNGPSHADILNNISRMVYLRKGLINDLEGALSKECLNQDEISKACLSISEFIHDLNASVCHLLYLLSVIKIESDSIGRLEILMADTNKITQEIDDMIRIQYVSRDYATDIFSDEVKRKKLSYMCMEMQKMLKVLFAVSKKDGAVIEETCLIKIEYHNGECRLVSLENDHYGKIPVLSFKVFSECVLFLGYNLDENELISAFRLITLTSPSGFSGTEKLRNAITTTIMIVKEEFSKAPRDFTQ